MDLGTYLQSLPKGGRAELARRLDISQSFLYQVARGLRQMPVDRVLAVERATGGVVGRHDLRPDIYPREPWCRCPACKLARRQRRRTRRAREEGAAA